MTDIRYWDDTLTEEVDVIETLMDDIPNLDGMEKAKLIDDIKNKLRGAMGTKRSFKMEIRLVQDVQSRKKYEARLNELDATLKRLNTDMKALESETNRGELFVESTSGGGGGGENGMDPTKAGDSMLKEASALQDKTQDSLLRTKEMIAESKEVGAATLEELERQREVLMNIERETDRIDDNLARAEVLLKQFGKKMASDSFIQCFALVNCCLLCGVVLYAIIKGKGLGGGGDDDNLPPSPTGDSDNSSGRLLLHYFLRRREDDY